MGHSSTPVTRHTPYTGRPERSVKHAGSPPDGAVFPLLNQSKQHRLHKDLFCLSYAEAAESVKKRRLLWAHSPFPPLFVCSALLLRFVAPAEAFVGGAVVRSAAGAGPDLYMAEPAMPALSVIAAALHRAADACKFVFVLFHFGLLLSVYNASIPRFLRRYSFFTLFFHQIILFPKS